MIYLLHVCILQLCDNVEVEAHNYHLLMWKESSCKIKEYKNSVNHLSIVYCGLQHSVILTILDILII